MPVLKTRVLQGGYHVFDEEQARAAGKALAASYRTATPFPHIALDDFVPGAMLEPVMRDFPSTEGRINHETPFEHLKYQTRAHSFESAAIRNVWAELNSRAMLGFLEEMTGIRHLIVDAYAIAGGLHETRRGGRQSVHADFNMHPQMRARRRINLLIYLNADWPEAYGGHLELWSRDMTRCEKKILPIFNRAVVFNTEPDTFHGNPEPVTCPQDRGRRSIAIYYYTAGEGDFRDVPRRTTNFRRRARSNDPVDWTARTTNLAADLLPPMIYRGLRRFAFFRRWLRE